jgi:predicted ATPase
MSYSAVRVFMNRFAAGAHPFELTDEVTPAVSEICRRLDGIALAIELAARRVEAYGLQATIALLDSPSRLFWPGEGSRSGRHRTLHATLDWSYSLLSPFERQTLRRLSVFGGMFSLEAAQSISDVDADHTQLTSTIAALVEKSLVITDTAAKTKRYRLIETMRIYLLLKLAESGERHLIARRHAIYCAELLASDERLPAMYAQHEPDVRAALQWSFSEEGDFGLGTALLTGSIPLLSRSLFEASVSRSD